MSEILTKYLTQRESSQLEFKSKIDSPFKIARTLSAFANTVGGVLLIGINDDRTVKGCSELEEMTKVIEAAEHLIIPPLDIRYRSVMWENRKKVLLVEIDESSDKPHEALDEKGNRTVYVRANDQTTPVSKEMSQILDKQTVRLRWFFVLNEQHLMCFVFFLQSPSLPLLGSPQSRKQFPLKQSKNLHPQG